MLKLKNSLLNFAWVQRAAKEVWKSHPRAPTTEMEMSGLVGAAELRHTLNYGLLIVAPPTPVPVLLYRMRYYDLPAPVYCRVPKPSHVFSPYEGKEAKGTGFLENRYMREDDGKAWLEQLSRTWSSHSVDKAVQEVYQSAPPVERYRTKYPRSVTIKYANFMRKQTKKNLAMGGLPAIAILNQKVSTLIPPQYGNFVVIDRRSIAPKLRENVSSDFPTLQPWDPPPACSCRALVSALDDQLSLCRRVHLVPRNLLKNQLKAPKTKTMTRTKRKKLTERHWTMETLRSLALTIGLCVFGFTVGKTGQNRRVKVHTQAFEQHLALGACPKML